jgi:hypothetical protein
LQRGARHYQHLFGIRNWERVEVSIVLPGKAGESVDWLDEFRRRGSGDVGMTISFPQFVEDGMGSLNAGAKRLRLLGIPAPTRIFVGVRWVWAADVLTAAGPVDLELIENFLLAPLDRCSDRAGRDMLIGAHATLPILAVGSDAM